MQESQHEEALRILTEIGENPGEKAGEKIDIGDAALALAALEDRAGKLAHYRNFLGTLVRDITRKAGDETALQPRILALRHTIAHAHGFTGDRATYNDLANANLMRVIDRRKASP